MFRRNVLVVTLLSLLALAACDKELVAVSDVVLDANKIYLGIGDSVTLNADVLPQDATNKRVSWTSSDATVASVNEKGVVTALKSGVTDIVVVTDDGSKEAVCEVNVLDLIFYKRTVLVYLAADNVALWSKRKGLDPRQSLSGEDATSSFYSPIRTVSGGINLTF